MQITIVFPFRNRDSLRVKKALNSLAQQSEKEFKVLFVDYGSATTIEREIASIVARYDFVQYHYLFTQYQPWNKSKALNYALRKTNTPYFFVADIDMMFRHDFVQKAIELSKVGTSRNLYFKVGFLSELETKKEKEFQDYQINFESNSEATGLTLFSTSELKSCGGFDEFYHFWGAEDTDVHVRLQNAGYSVVFYDNEILMLHQWHPSYRSLERNKLTQDLQLSGVVRLNHQHLMEAIQLKKTKINYLEQDYIMSQEDVRKLQEDKEVLVLINKKEAIDHFLFVELPNFKNGILNVTLLEDPFQNSLKHRLKKIMRKKVPNYYTLKEINDMFLLHIISFHHNYNYIYKVSEDLKSIEFKIQKP
jgi:glycosyltransferase involved in cell wall biosynthesis